MCSSFEVEKRGLKREIDMSVDLQNGFLDNIWVLFGSLR